MKLIKSTLIILILSVFLYGCSTNKNETLENNNVVDTPVEQKKVQIVDLDSNKRVYAVMINNNHAAWPQSGLKSAYMVYEIMVEGGITRMMALYTQDAIENKIGSIRSSRHNYLDYVLENDAIYIHWGGSNLAYDDIKSLKIDHIDGMVYGGTYYETDSSLKRALEHTRFTSTSMINKGIENLKIRNTSNAGYLLKYTTEDVDLTKREGSIEANKINIKYSNYQNASYTYDSETGKYKRFMNDKPHSDLVTNEQYEFKNIILYKIQYKTLSDGKLQDLQNIGSGEGYYVTNGAASKITWKKDSRSSKTKYYFADGNEIEVSDGNTFIQIIPNTGNYTIS